MSLEHLRGGSLTNDRQSTAVAQNGVPLLSSLFVLCSIFLHVSI